MNWNLLVSLYNAWQLRAVNRKLDAQQPRLMPVTDLCPEQYEAGLIQGPPPAPPAEQAPTLAYLLQACAMATPSDMSDEAFNQAWRKIHDAEDKREQEASDAAIAALEKKYCS